MTDLHADSARRACSAVERWLIQRALANVGQPAVRIRLWDGQELGASTQDAVGVLWVRHPSVL
ncbi:MAG TPA: hypothetical protein VK137_03655, partial [Planctomycetaceae bacterium]|nr:hypothetical protein [Planctomycetaceae bacterium]